MLFNIIRNALLLFILVSCALPTFASSVFKISKGDRTVYIGGTMHVLSQTDYPLPKGYKTAYQDAQTLVFETDMAALTSLEFQQQMLSKLTYLDGTTLEDVLSLDTLNLLKMHLKSRSVPYESVKTMKPGFAGITLSVIELSAIGLNAQGVDAYYHMMAMGDGKAIDWLETPMEQISFLAQLGEENSDEYIKYTLDEIDTMPNTVNALKGAWKAGDMQELERVGVTTWAKDYPDIYNLILANRNEKWMERLVPMFETDETEFVLVGALHLVGEHGLIPQFKQLGYTIQQM
jgi:uncharacterized protein YbaP (TraB family)